MKQSTPSATFQISFRPVTMKQLERLSRRTGLKRNDVVRYAIAKLAEREGITTARKQQSSRNKRSNVSL